MPRLKENQKYIKKHIDKTCFDEEIQLQERHANSEAR